MNSSISQPVQFNMVESRQSFVPQNHSTNLAMFKPTDSIIAGEFKPIPNLLRQSLIVSYQIRQLQMQQVHPEIAKNSKIQEVETDFDKNQQLEYRLALQQELNPLEETDIKQQSIILQSGLFVQQEKIPLCGWLMKRSKSLIWPYKQRYCTFQDGIFCVYQNEQKKRATIVLNFQMFNFKYFSKIEQLQLVEFGLKCEDDEKVFSFKGEEVQKWFNAIKNYIEKYRLSPKFDYYIGPFEQYYKKRLIRNQQFLEMAETGDILLFQGKHISCKMQRVVTRSDYDHVAMVLKYTNGQIYVLEATGTYGVGIFDWSNMMSKQWYELYNKVVYRKLEVKRTVDFLQKIETFTRDNIGKEYRLTVSKLLTEKSTIMNQKHNQTYFCSQLIASAFKQAGILKTELASTQFWPGSFSNEKNDLVLTNALLSDEYLIGFNM